VSHNGRQYGSYPILSVPKRCRTCLLPNALPSSGRRRRRRRKIHFLLDRWTQEVEKHVQLADVRPAATPGSVRDPSTPRWAHHRPRRTVSIIRSPVSMSCHQGAPGRRGLRPLRRISFFFYFVPFCWKFVLKRTPVPGEYFLNNIFFLKK
jgi:hypothetical protein